MNVCAIASPLSHVPHRDPMHAAYLALLYRPFSEREEHLAALFAGENAGWAYFALSRLELTDDHRTALCAIIAHEGSAELALWALWDDLNLSARHRATLRTVVVESKSCSWAQEGLRTVSDWTPAQAAALEQIARGMHLDT